MALILLDSGTIIGFLDVDDAFHDAADAKLRVIVGRETLLASVVTYAELLAGVYLGHHAEQPTRGFFNDIVNHILPVDVEVAERAAHLRGRRQGVKMADALIIATAELHADAIVTSDDQWPKLAPACHLDLLTP